MPTTVKVSVKLYRCSRCGLESVHSTNHWGDIYSRCNGCSWKNPISPQVTMVCLESMPKGFTSPPNWKIVRLSDCIVF